MGDQYDNASIHGVCFDNGMSGNCNEECEQFTDGDCDVGDEILQGYIDSVADHVREEIILEFYNDVELFLLRGKGASDETLVTDALYAEYGYNKE